MVGGGCYRRRVTLALIPSLASAASSNGDGALMNT